MPVDVERIKDVHPIADVVESLGVELRPAGRRLVGQCPFHSDTRPSFWVYPDTRSFHCFGCGADGDAIDFVRRMHDLDFLAAVDYLGELPPWERRTPRPATRPTPPKRLSLDDRLILTAASELYHESLMRTPEARMYVEGRRIPAWLMRRARLGYSTGTELLPYLKRRRLSLRRATEMGLLYPDRRHGELREAMRGRIVIPDLRPGHCAWMTGRSTADDASLPHLDLALPKPLLGYDLVRGRSRIFVTEGAFDWLTLLSWGLPACTALGTHPSRGALELLTRARRVVLVMDGDTPGQEATQSLQEALGEKAVCITLPVKDVNKLAEQEDGRETFFRLLAAAEGGEHDVPPSA